MLRVHYRQPIDWTVRELERAYDDLSEWYTLINSESISDGIVDHGVLEALCDDLNTHGALVRVHELASLQDGATLRASLGFLGFSCEQSKLSRRYSLQPEPGTLSLTVTDAPDVAVFELRGDGTYSSTDPSTQKRIDELIATRRAARARKDWSESDRIRDELAAMHVALKDNKDGTTTWEFRP